MFSKPLVPILALVLMALGVFSYLQRAEAQSGYHYYRFTQLEAMMVENSHGKELGKISDVVFDLEGGTIRYVVLTSGGLRGMREQHVAVPFDTLVLKSKPDGMGDFFVFQPNKEQWCLTGIPTELLGSTPVGQSIFINGVLPEKCPS